MTRQIQVALLELILILVVVVRIPEKRRDRRSKSQQPKMVKSLSALAVFMLLGALVIALPGFAPEVEADEVAALAKSDRLEVRAVVPNCST